MPHASQPNRLIHETSPYLLQHAYNPVDWYPWGPEALQKAQAEDKPIFLSIGYSACHWCHVMEEECFENPAIAALMNQYFINIKVDREERPDLDEIYMTAVQAITGSGGWPMSVFLLPSLQPFYGGTYFPPDNRYGRPGFPAVLESLAQTFRERRADCEKSAASITTHIQSLASLPQTGTPLQAQWIARAREEMARRFDAQHGGFGTAPKFPHSMDLSLLLRHYKTTGDSHTLVMVEHTLRQMAAGGMYDHLGGGFHRYSVDEAWQIPHFEKMLYDNALLTKTYLEAYQVTKNPFYRTVAEDCLAYVLREMTAPNGAFYSTQDADSEGGEGAFFVWTPEQVEAVLGPDHAKIACAYYGIEPGGNFEEGSTVLHIASDIQTLENRFALPNPIHAILQEARQKLFFARQTRPCPATDQKILTDWNALMISAFALATGITQEPRYLQAATRAADFLLTQHVRDGRLLHTSKDGHAHTFAFCSDYAYLAAALLDIYEITGDRTRIAQALGLVDALLTHFWDEAEGAFFFTSEEHQTPITRSKSSYDSSVPSGNAVAIQTLLRLAKLTGQAVYAEKAQHALQSFAEPMSRMPFAFPQMLCALDFYLTPPVEIILAASHPQETTKLQRALFAEFLPNKVALYTDGTEPDSEDPLSPLLSGKHPIAGQPAAYICQNFTCQAPCTTPEEVRRQLEGK